MRLARPLIICAIAAAAVVALAPPASAQGTLRLTEAGGARFPYRAFILTLPSGASLDAERVHVRENGREVSSVSLTPADEAGEDQFGVVLVIDASNSMRGKAIEAAMGAARAFAERRNSKQQVAIIAFNRETTIVLPFTADGDAIERALAEPPPLAEGTRIYDALDTALSVVERADVTAGSIVVLSDGTDTGSSVDKAALAAKAEDARVRIFSVGLRSGSFSPDALESLANAAGGKYSEASSSADLETVFADLGSQLANEYLLKYRSLASAEEDVDVTVTVDGIAGGAGESYKAPALPPGAGSPFHQSLPETLWRSGEAMVAVSLLSAALVTLALLLLLRPRKRTLRARMAQFVSLVNPSDEKRQGAVRAEAVLNGAEKSFERLKWWARFKQDLEVAEFPVSATKILAGTAIAMLVVGLLAYALLGPLFALAALAVPVAVRMLVKRKLERRRKLFSDQLPDNLQVLSSALRAGHSLIGALSMVVEDSPEPARSEFRRVIADEQLGVPLEDAFAVVVSRMDNRDLEQVALIAALQRETGGNTAEVVDRVAETIRERFELRRLIRTLTAQGRMSRWVVSLLPVGLLVIIMLVNPGYMTPLFQNPLGRMMLVGAAVMIIAGSVVIKKIVDIKV